MYGRIVIAVFAIVGAVAIPGCSGSDPSKVRVSGRVERSSGEPVKALVVVFYPAAGPSTAARTDEDGQFTTELSVGECKVGVVSNAVATSTDTSPAAIREQQIRARADSSVNPKFFNPETSGLTINVRPEESEDVVLVVD